ncbi:hypothetical protein [Fodinicola feengrottensis]|uniref:Uncharacterized protein n=1 Tax=Fodinicola feengrottensis TaxID=435914 RepID=A0ABN2JAW9_9ACTN|nr:hypothetical protein [Fodinicola feengrottensis]
MIATLGMSVPARTVRVADIHADFLPAVVAAAAEISKRLGALPADDNEAGR